MRRQVFSLITGLLFFVLAQPASAGQVVLLEGNPDLKDTPALVRDVGDFRFAVFPDDYVLSPGFSRLELLPGEEMFLVELEEQDFGSLGVRTLVSGSRYALVAAEPNQSRVLDSVGACRERVTWIEPLAGTHDELPDITAKVDAQVKADIVAAVSQSRFSVILRELSGNIVFWLNGNLESTNNRYTHTAGSGDDIDIAAAYLEDRLEVAGYPVTRQSFDVSGTTTDNIIAIKTGTTMADEIIVVGAHYDTTSENPNSLAPGAEDNGSGSAAVIHLAELFADYETERTIHFVLFSGEEQGLYGSQHYVSQLGANGWNVTNALTMDMISAWESNYKVIIEGQTPWESLMSLFETNVSNWAQIASRKDYHSFGSDHVPFQQAGIPAFLAIDWDYGSYDHYHRTTDTWQYLDASLGYRIVQAMAGTLADLTNPTPKATPAPASRNRLSLDQNSPNPFNPRTMIRFELDQAGFVSVEVFDLAGRRVRTIVSERLGAGPHIAQWDGTDHTGAAVSSGNYLLRLESEKRVLSRRMTLVR